MLVFAALHPCIVRSFFAQSSKEQVVTARKALTKALRNALIAARVPNAELYKGHSFRRGGATSLARVGVADSVIKTMGRWKSHA